MTTTILPLILASAFCLGQSARLDTEVRIDEDSIGLLDASEIEDSIGSMQAAAAPGDAFANISSMQRLLCAAWRSGCGKLDQSEDPDNTKKQSISMGRVKEYFDAKTEAMEMFWKELKLPEDCPCEDLCIRSLHYIAEKLRWPLPDRRGYQCGMWSEKHECLSWVPNSDAAMEVAAESLDLATKSNMLEEQWTETEAVDEKVSFVKTGPGLSPTLDYSPTDLAVRILNIFDVFPSEHYDDASGASVLENEEDPTFGEHVSTDRYAEWRRTLEQSQSWVRTATTKLPGNLHALKTWFGGADTATYEKVRRVLLGMQDTLDKAKIVVGKGPPDGICGGSTMAYVSIFDVDRSVDGGSMREWGYSEKDGDRYVIHVCKLYWENIADDALKYGTIIHESAHHHGPVDERYKGARPYGRAQALRMASEAPEKAMDNADNYRWFVYYLNRCSEKAMKVFSAPPAELRLETNENGMVTIAATFSQEVNGIALKYKDASGTYIKKATTFKKSLADGSYTLKDIELPSDTRVLLFFEADCIFWEATGIVQKYAAGKQSYEAKPVHVLSSGGGPASAALVVKPATPLPCKIALPSPRPRSFHVQVQCEEKIENGQLRFQLPASSSNSSKDVRNTDAGTIEAGSTKDILFGGSATLPTETYYGYTFVFSAKGYTTISATLPYPPGVEPAPVAPAPKKTGPMLPPMSAAHKPVSFTGYKKGKVKASATIKDKVKAEAKSNARRTVSTFACLWICAPLAFIAANV